MPRDRLVTNRATSPRGKLPLQSAEIANGTAVKSARNGPNPSRKLLRPIADNEPIGQPVYPLSQKTTRRRRVAHLAKLEGGLPRFRYRSISGRVRPVPRRLHSRAVCDLGALEAGACAR